MKRFQFQLETVLDYKQQILDELMIQLGEAQAAVADQQRVRDAAKKRFIDYGKEYEQRKREGLTVVDALKYQGCLERLEKDLWREEERLDDLKERAEEKRQDVVQARQESFSLEKLKDIRRKEYDAAVAKEEEKALDDLTIARRSAAAAAAQNASA